MLILFAQFGATEADIFFLDINSPARFQNDLNLDCHNPRLDDSKWPTMQLSQLTERQHYCLRLTVDINQTDIPTGTSLQIAMLASSEIYWDGKQIATKGIPGTKIEEEIVGPIGRSISMRTEQLTIGKHLLSMRVSTYHHSADLSVIHYGILLIDYPKSVSLSEQNKIPPLLLIGALLLLFILFQLIYWFYQKDLALLLFSFLCLASGALIALELIKFYYPYPWDWHIIRLRVIIATTLLTSCLLFLYYIYYYHIQKFRLAFIAFVVGLALTTIFLKSYDAKSLLIFFLTLVAGIAINTFALKQGKKNAAANSIILVAGLVSLIALPSSFIEKWFGVLFSIIAIANLFSLVKRFGQDREKALISLKLESELLRRNLQPHFLMNSLTLIIEWIETQPKLAVEFIESLAEEFRLLNNMSKDKLVSLGDEIELCQKHIAIMSYRYQLTIDLKITVEDPHILLPPAIIHTLIENCFSHNKVETGDCIEIITRVKNDRCEISVSTPFRRVKHQGTGTGEEYIRSRLTESFANRWQFTSKQQADVWLSKLTFPIQMNSELQ